MEDLLQLIRNLKTRAKNLRDRQQYQLAVDILAGDDGAIPIIQNEITTTTLQDWRAQLASELCDCYGLVGGINRRCGLESQNKAERILHLKDSVKAYQAGRDIEQNPEYNIANSYNLLNRLISYIFLKPECLGEEMPPPGVLKEDISYDIRKELETAESVIQEQLKEKRRGDIWGLADLALVRILLGKTDPSSAYWEFLSKSPPDYAFESVLSILRPLAELPLPVAGELKNAAAMLEGRLNQAKR